VVRPEATVRHPRRREGDQSAALDAVAPELGDVGDWGNDVTGESRQPHEKFLDATRPEKR